MHMVSCLVLAALTVAPPGAKRSTGLSGLGRPGGLLAADPKAQAFETQLLAAVNEARATAKMTPVTLDPRLRAFARNEARMAAKGDPTVKTAAERIARQRLAPHGHYLHYTYGVSADAVVVALRKAREARQVVEGAFGAAGIGAFWVPVDEPYFQVAILVAKEVDPMAGKPGLSRDQTNEVMAAAEPQVKACYDRLLEDDPNAGGNVMLKIIIGGVGKVDKAELLKGMKSEAFNRCLRKTVKGLVFPKPYKGKPVTLTHPLRFNPPTGGKRVGRLRPGQISGALRPAQRDFRACYDSRLKSRPALRGTLELAITVAGDGRLAKVTLDRDDLGDTELQQCILKRAQKLRFPKPEFGGDVEIKLPLTFEPHRSSDD